MIIRIVVDILDQLKLTIVEDAKKAEMELGWTPSMSAKEMCAEMIKKTISMQKRPTC